MNDEVFYVCMCGCSAVTLDNAFWLESGCEPEVLLSLWRCGVGGFDSGIRVKLRHIWHIVRYGHPYTDTVILKAGDAHDLAKHLIEFADAADKAVAEDE